MKGEIKKHKQRNKDWKTERAKAGMPERETDRDLRSTRHRHRMRAFKPTSAT